MSRTERIASFVSSTAATDVPDAVLHATKRVVVDTVACVVGALGTDEARPVLRFVQAMGGAPEATLAGHRGKLPVASVSFAHAQLANLLDADDTFRMFSHFANVVVLPALATAEAVGADGTDLLASVAVGFEVAARVGSTLERYRASGEEVTLSPIRGYSWACFGAAAAVARLRGLDEDGVRQALALSFALAPVNLDTGRLTAPLFEPERAPVGHKYAFYGAIADAGVRATLLAELGFTGDPTVLDEGSSYWRSFGASSHDPSPLDAFCHGGWAIAETELKPYPMCRHAHRALDLFQRIVDEEDVRPDEIESVTVTVPPYEILRKIAEAEWPDHPLKVMMALRYGFWMQLLRVPPGPGWWDRAHLEDGGGRRFAARVRCVVEQSWSSILVEQLEAIGSFPRYPTRVTVATSRGTFEGETEFARGTNEPAAFRLTDDDLSRKALDFMTPALGAGAEPLLDALWSVDRPGGVERVAAALSDRRP